MVICFDWQRLAQSLSLFTIAKGCSEKSLSVNQQWHELERFLSDLRQLVLRHTASR